MKAKLLALAAFLVSAGAGIFFVDFGTGQRVTLPESFGAFEVVDRSACGVSNCNAPGCLQANNILTDAGNTECVTKVVDCSVRIGRRARNLAADAGLTFDGGLYHHLRFIALKCGDALGIPVGDAGYPTFALTEAASPCAWKPSEGAVCTKADGGDPGVRNTMQPGDWSGPGCVQKTCAIFAGDLE